MSADPEHPSTPPGSSSVATAGDSVDQRSGVDQRFAEVIDRPVTGDGAALWRIARGTGVLDVNSGYAYLMWCRDFADTSVVVRSDGRVVGFIIGYLRPTAPETLFVWQVAVDAACRGRNLAGRMLHHLADRTGCRWLETTVSPDNAASIAMFTAFARDRNTEIRRSDLFAAQDFPAEADPEGHQPEDLYRIGPLPGGT